MTSPAPAAGDAEEIARLEEERDFLLTSLRDLEQEREASDIGDDDYRTLHDDYTARAAETLRALEEARTPPPAVDPDTPAPSPGTGSTGAEAGAPRRVKTVRTAPSRASTVSRSRRFVVGVTIVLIVAVAAGVGIVSFTGTRTGGNGGSGTATSATARHLAKAQQLEGQSKAAEALKEYDAAIAADPSNVVALTYKGWLLARAGFADPAMASLDKAVATNPNYPDAHFFRGMVLYQLRNDPAGAVPEFETYLASNPPADAADAVRQVLDKARNGVPPPSDAAPDTAPPSSAPAAAPPG